MFVLPDYVVPRFAPGQDVRGFLRELSWAAHHNRVLYEFALGDGLLTVCPPSLVGEARRALDYARLIRRLPAVETVFHVVQQRRAPVSTVVLASEINASVRTAYNYAAALEAAGLLCRRSRNTGWMAAGVN